MPRYEFVEGTSAKFWEIELSGSSFTTRWGRLGTPGQTKQQAFPDAASARKEYDALVRSKEKKGYQRVATVTPLAPPATTAPQSLVVRLEGGLGWWRELELDGSTLIQRSGRTGTAQPPEEASNRYDSVSEAKETLEHLVERYGRNGLKEVSRQTGQATSRAPARADQPFVDNPEYERACLSAEGDERPWRIYADWLQERGDLRGELAALLLNRDAKAAWALVQRARRRLLGEHGPREVDELEFTFGFLSGLLLRRGDDDDETELADLTADVLAHPGARLVTRLRFGLASTASDNDWTQTLAAVLAAPQAGWLRRLEFNAYTYEDCEISWTPFGDFSALWRGLPALQHLHVRSGGGGTLGRIAHTGLTTFIRESGGLSAAELTAIAQAEWPQLERLEVWTGSSNYGAEATTALLEPMLFGRGLPNLRSLGLVNSELSVELLPILAGSPLVQQLKVLDLSKGVFTDREVDQWVKLAPKFRHLTRLDLSENLFEEGLERLKAALPNAVVADQRDYEADEDDFRYVAVGE